MIDSINIDLDVQYAVDLPDLPTHAELQFWVIQALIGRRNQAELVIRIVDEIEIATLNDIYRHRSGSTNVLSFPFTTLPQVPITFIGDIVICAALIIKEAMEQGKTLKAHWAHIVIHGVLHLIGYDHKTITQAQDMEKLEEQILKNLGYPNPYMEIVELNHSSNCRA